MLCDTCGTQDVLCAEMLILWHTKARGTRLDGHDGAVCVSIPAFHDPQPALRATNAPHVETGNYEPANGNSHIVPNTQGKRPTNPMPASLVSLLAGVFRSPNFIRRQVMVRSEQWWRRLFADLRSQGGRCGSVVRWRGFTCRHSIGGRSGLRIECFHRGLIGQRQKSTQWSQLGLVDYGRWPDVGAVNAGAESIAE